MIDAALIERATGLKVDPQVRFGCMGILQNQQPEMLSLLSADRYFGEVEGHPTLKGVITTAELAPRVQALGLQALISPEPRLSFCQLQNYRVEHAPTARWPSRIDPGAHIHPRAFVAENNVVIGPGTRVGPNASILEDVEIGADCIIQANAVVGAEGYEYQRTSQGLLLVRHNGRVVLGRAVEVGSCAVLDKGLFEWDATVVGDETKIDNLVHVAHSVKLGRGCMIIAGAVLCGSIHIDDGARVGPGAVVSNGVHLAPNSVVSLGSVATRSVGAGEQVTGNFAIEHRKFLNFLKTIR